VVEEVATIVEVVDTIRINGTSRISINHRAILSDIRIKIMEMAAVREEMEEVEATVEVVEVEEAAAVVAEDIRLIQQTS
jgi:hypothetical protein